MSIVLGFGSTEEKVRAQVKDALISALLHKQEIWDVLKQWNDKADEYDEMPRETAPERYTRIFYYDNKLHFHHVNRRHAMSPDGWALLAITESFGERGEEGEK